MCKIWNPVYEYILFTGISASKPPYFPLILLALSYDCPLQFLISRPTVSKKNSTGLSITGPPSSTYRRTQARRSTCEMSGVKSTVTVREKHFSSFTSSMMNLSIFPPMILISSSQIVEDRYDTDPLPCSLCFSIWAAIKRINLANNSSVPRKFPLWTDPKRSSCPRKSYSRSAKNVITAITLSRTAFA